MEARPRRPAASDERPIGVFDSGVGGLSVLREIRRQLPAENSIYLADTANCPYGSKSKAELQALALRNAEFLLEQGAKLVVVACNTASVAALPALRATFAVPFVGLVPAVKPAALATRTRRVAVLATPATFQGEMFADLVRDFAADVEVIQQVCPGLVELVERGVTDGPEARALLERYLQPALDASVDAIVLGCTHYPFLRPVIEEIAGPRVRVLDSGEAVARQVCRVLDRQGIRRRPEAGRGQTTFYSSSPDVGRLRPVFEKLTGEPEPRILFASQAR